jgi:hypothetical protein
MSIPLTRTVITEMINRMSKNEEACLKVSGFTPGAIYPRARTGVR